MKEQTVTLRIYLRDGGGTLATIMPWPDRKDVPDKIHHDYELAEWLAIEYWKQIDPDVNVNGPRTVVFRTEGEGAATALVLLRREAIGCSVTLNGHFRR